MDQGPLGGRSFSVRAQRRRTWEDFGNRRCSGAPNQERGHPFSIEIRTGEGDEEHNERNCRKRQGVKKAACRKLFGVLRYRRRNAKDLKYEQ